MEPPIGITVMYWVVMNIIEAGEKVTLRAHVSLEGVIPTMPPTLRVFAIPGVGGPSVKLTEGFQ